VRLLIRVVCLLWCSGNFLGAFAQDTTTRTGFAVVTLVSGNVAGLIANETLRNRTDSSVEQAVVAPSPLITSASMLVPLGPVGENTTAIALANPSMGSGGVNLILTDALGRVVLNVIVQLGPHGQLSRYLNEFFATPPTEFSTPLLLTLTAEIPVAVLALNFRGDDFTSIPLTSLSTPTPVPVQSSPAIGGASALVFAQVATGAWSTDIAVGNTSAGLQSIRIDFFGSDGVSRSSLTNIVIPPRGVFSFSTDSAQAAIQ
jgi:hypothetical protein